MFVFEKKNVAYMEFLLLIQKIMTHNLISFEGKDNEAIKKVSSEILELNEIVKSKINLYYSVEISNMACEILRTVNPMSEEEAKEYNIKREKLIPEILILMRRDLGVDL